MNEDEILDKYGLRPTGRRLDEIRSLLKQLTSLGPDADTLAMKLYCVQLFNGGSVFDVLLIWRAKESSWDAHCSVDVQLLCGAGLEATKAYLADRSASDAREALGYLAGCESSGDFDGFSVASQSAWYDRYYNSGAGQPQRMTAKCLRCRWPR